MASVIGAPETEEYAISFTSAPSSSRTFDFVRVAMKTRTSSGSCDTFLLRLLVQDGHRGLEVRRLHIDHQAPFEAGSQPLHKPRHLLRGESLEITICF